MSCRSCKSNNNNAKEQISLQSTMWLRRSALVWAKVKDFSRETASPFNPPPLVGAKINAKEQNKLRNLNWATEIGAHEGEKSTTFPGGGCASPFTPLCFGKVFDLTPLRSGKGFDFFKGTIHSLRQ